MLLQGIFGSAYKPGIPLLTVFMATGVVVPGIIAIFCVPVIPGPEIKKPNRSLKEEHTYSGYSSLAKTYLN